MAYTNSGAGTANVCMRWTGQAASPFDTCGTAAQGTAANPSITVTAATSGELIIAAMVSDSGTITAGTSPAYTLTTGAPYSANFFEATEYLLNSASGSNNAGFTNSTSANYSITACAFKHA